MKPRAASTLPPSDTIAGDSDLKDPLGLPASRPLEVRDYSPGFPGTGLSCIPVIMKNKRSGKGRPVK